MISEIQIENFKSIAELSLQPGTVTVLIGENGSGKSNILEAIGFAAAATLGKLDDEFLFNRGIRVTEKDWMRSAFVEPKQYSKSRRKTPAPIHIRIDSEDLESPLDIRISQSNNAKNLRISDRWNVSYSVDKDEIEKELQAQDFLADVELFRQQLADRIPEELVEKLARNMVAHRRAAAKKREQAPEISATLCLHDFLIYSPENTELRNFDTEGAIKPLGPKGEGLLKLLSSTAASGSAKFSKELKSQLKLLGWFGDLRLPTDEDEIRGQLMIQDRWISTDGPVFDQRSANEGFLYLLFYFTLFLSQRTPKFFGIDNIDNSLNPKLCAELMRQLAALAEKTGKQAICTTHNPAILDGLNLNDDKQRLYVVHRNSKGHTVVNRVPAPRPRPEGEPVKLSTAFTSGLLGGLPDHF